MGESLDALRSRKQAEAEALACGKAAIWTKAENAGSCRDFVNAVNEGGVIRCVVGAPGDTLPAAQAYAVVTDRNGGGGGIENLQQWRERTDAPIVWWDHVVSPVQIAEARAAGADVVRITLTLIDDETLDDCLTAAERAGCIALVVVSDDEQARRAMRMGAEVIASRDAGLQASAWRSAGAISVLDIVRTGVASTPGADAVIVGSAD